MWWFLLWQAAPEPWYTMYAAYETSSIAALPRKVPMDATFSHIKAVLCDLDGTLLTSKHTVSQRTVAAIRVLR